MGIWQKLSDQLRGQAVEAQLVDQHLPALTPENRQVAIDAQRTIMTWKRAAAIANTRMYSNDQDYDGSLGRGRIHALGNVGPAERMRAISMRRAEGRMLYQRNAMAMAAVELWPLFVVANGYNYRFRPQKRNATRFHKAWNRWAFSTEAHIQRHHTLAELDAQRIRTAKGEGEVLMRWHRPLDGRAVPLALQVMQTDHIAQNMYFQSRDKTGQVVDGIDRNRYGAPIGIWIHPIHPNDGWSEPEYVPWYDPKIGQQIEIYFMPEAPGLSRGVNNPGAIALDLALDAADFRGLRLDRAREEASESKVITTGSMPVSRLNFQTDGYTAPEGGQEPIAGQDYDPETQQPMIPAMSVDSMTPDNWMEMFHLVNTMFSSPGATPVLLPGMDIKTRTMAPSSDFEPFWRCIQAGIAQAYGVPGPWLSQDAGDANRSAMDNVVQPFRNAVEQTQESDINRCANITARNFIQAAQSVGICREGPETMDFSVNGNRMPTTQSDKDIRVLVTRLANGLIDFDKALQLMGEDPTEIREKLKENRDFYESLGWFDRPMPFTISPQYMADPNSQNQADTASAGGGPGNAVDN